MRPTPDDIREMLHQRFDPHTVRLAPTTFLERSKRRAFAPPDIAALFHENSKYVPELMDVTRRSAGEFDRPHMRWITNEVAPDYPGHEYVNLPTPSVETGTLEAALATRRTVRSFDDQPVPLEKLATILGRGAGVTAIIDTAEGELSLRSYPSAGALYPVEVYVVTAAISNLSSGLYYYVPNRHGLRRLRTGIDPTVVEESLVGDEVRHAAGVIVLTAAFPRTKAKYGPRGYRYVLQESGHMAQNFALVAAGLGLGTLPIGGFYDDQVNDLLGVDGVDESAVYAIAIGIPGADE